MDEDEEKKEQKENSGIINKVRDGARKANKSKYALKAVLKTVLNFPILIKIMAIAIIFSLIVAGVGKLLNMFGDNSINYVASPEIMKKDVRIAKASDEEGYYFKISKDVVEDYIKQLDKATKKGYYLSREPEDEEEDGGTNNASGSIEGDGQSVALNRMPYFKRGF